MVEISHLEAPHFGRVGVLLGGRSHERPISLRSGEAVYQALKSAGLDVVKIDTGKPFLPFLRKNPIDLAFLALHGAGGEDGTIQKVMERLQISYVGSSPHASGAAFDKARAKKVFERHQIPTPAYEVITKANWRKKIERWNPPYVIKPANEGSSIGVFFIERRSDGPKRIQQNLKQYPKLIVERKIEGRELTVGILGAQALPPIELKPKRKFYDYQAKYTKGLTEYLIPAPIPEALSAKLKSLALQVHQILELRDLSRVDFMVASDGNPFVLEVNSIPGFTETSLLPKAAKCIGIDFTNLCLSLLEMARQRNGVLLKT